MRPLPPSDSKNEALSDFQADLVLYDGAVAGYICSLLGGVSVDERNLLPDTELRKRLETILLNGDSTVQAEAQIYLSYLDTLDKLLATAREL